VVLINLINMKLEDIKITMLGTTGAGKTSYLLGMYAVMQTGVQGFTLAAKDMDLDLELTQRWEKLISLKGEDRLNICKHLNAYFYVSLENI